MRECMRNGQPPSLRFVIYVRLQTMFRTSVLACSVSYACHRPKQGEVGRNVKVNEMAPILRLLAFPTRMWSFPASSTSLISTTMVKME